MPLNSEWQPDPVANPPATTGRLSNLLRNEWIGDNIVLIVRTPASDAELTKALLDALVANTVGNVDPRLDPTGWRRYTP